MDRSFEFHGAIGDEDRHLFLAFQIPIGICENCIPANLFTSCSSNTNNRPPLLLLQVHAQGAVDVVLHDGAQVAVVSADADHAALVVRAGANLQDADGERRRPPRHLRLLPPLRRGSFRMFRNLF